MKLLFTKKISKKELSILNPSFEVITENFINISYQYPSEIPKSNHFILTSQNGLESLINLFAVDYLKDKFYYVVGEKTAQKLTHFSSNIQLVAQDVEELVEKLILTPENQFVYFCSNLRLDYLKHELENKKKNIQEIISYQTSFLPKKIENTFDAIVFLSPSGVDAYFLENSINENTQLFAIGNTTKEAIKKYTSKDVLTPIEPKLQNLLELINQVGI